jgi:hypothetical protein
MGFLYIVAIIVGEVRRSKKLRQQPIRSNAGSGSDIESPTTDKAFS